MCILFQQENWLYLWITSQKGSVVNGFVIYTVNVNKPTRTIIIGLQSDLSFAWDSQTFSSEASRRPIFATVNLDITDFLIYNFNNKTVHRFGVNLLTNAFLT